MERIKPHLTASETLCVEAKAPPSALVVFGASGDLAHRKLIPSLFQIFGRGLLDESFYLLGCGRKELSDEDFRAGAHEAILKTEQESSPGELEQFLGRCHFIWGDYDDISFYIRIKNRLGELDKQHKVQGCRVFYLAVPPLLYCPIAEKLRSAGLSYTDKDSPQNCARLVIEKPFGRDLQSATELDSEIHKHFTESQIYRIDHYLGKETVQNILMFRFANSIFEPIWNRNYIDHVQITIAETLGVEHRSGYYDQAGALRDIFQNHMLQMLCLVAMEPPSSFEADRIRDEKTKVLRSIRPFQLNPWTDSIATGQYTAGLVDGKAVPAYRSEAGIDPHSRTETFVTARLFIDNWRWKGVPFYLRTGKRLARRLTEIAVNFKSVPHSMFAASGIEEMPSNALVFQIQPNEGIYLSFEAKCPGSKICMCTLMMNFNYKEVFGIEQPEAYQRLLLDCMVGDQTLFNRQDDVKLSWELITPVLEAWEKAKAVPHEYPAGSESFPAADKLIEPDGRSWRKLSEI